MRFSKRLIAKDGVDADLADILATRILKAERAQNAVARAKDAITELAAERAKTEAGDG